MDKNKEHFYLVKGENDSNPWLYYGKEPPVITGSGTSNGYMSDCILVGSFCDNPIAKSLKDNEIIKLYIRKETIKNKKNE